MSSSKENNIDFKETQRTTMTTKYEMNGRDATNEFSRMTKGKYAMQEGHPTKPGPAQKSLDKQEWYKDMDIVISTKKQFTTPPEVLQHVKEIVDAFLEWKKDSTKKESKKVAKKPKEADNSDSTMDLPGINSFKQQRDEEEKVVDVPKVIPKVPEKQDDIIALLQQQIALLQQQNTLLQEKQEKQQEQISQMEEKLKAKEVKQAENPLVEKPLTKGQKKNLRIKKLREKQKEIAAQVVVPPKKLTRKEKRKLKKQAKRREKRREEKLKLAEQTGSEEQISEQEETTKNH